MVSPGKPETDWHDIRRRFESGEPANAIAKTVPVSKQAVLAKAKRQGWKIDPSRAKLSERAKEWQSIVATNSATGRQLATQDNRSSTQLANWGKRTPENAAIILAKIEESGAPHYLCAQAAGISPDTLTRWLKSDPDFAAQIAAAEAQWATGQVQVITSAAFRGDWRAAAHGLAKHPATRDTWGDQAGSSSGLTLNINIARAETPAQEADIVDVTPERHEG